MGPECYLFPKTKPGACHGWGIVLSQGFHGQARLLQGSWRTQETKSLKAGHPPGARSCVLETVPALGSSNLPSGGWEVSFPTGYWALECHFQQSPTLGPSPALSDAQDVGKWILVARLSRCNVKTSPLPFNIVSIHPPPLCWGYILVLSVDPSWLLRSHLLLAHSVESLLLSMPPPPHAPISPSTVKQSTVNRHCLLLGLLRECALCLLPFTGFALPYISP